MLFQLWVYIILVIFGMFSSMQLLFTISLFQNDTSVVDCILNGTTSDDIIIQNSYNIADNHSNEVLQNVSNVIWFAFNFRTSVLLQVLNI